MNHGNFKGEVSWDQSCTHSTPLHASPVVVQMRRLHVASRIHAVCVGMVDSAVCTTGAGAPYVLISGFRVCFNLVFVGLAIQQMASIFAALNRLEILPSPKNSRGL